MGEKKNSQRKFLRESNQFKLNYSTMNIFLKIFVILTILIKSECFLTFPFKAQDALDIFLRTISNEVKIEENVMKYAIPGELCYRKCEDNDAKVCYFKLIIKYYQILSG